MCLLFILTPNYSNKNYEKNNRFHEHIHDSVLH